MLMRALLLSILVGILALPVSARAAAAPTAADLLQQAEDVRSSDPAEFRKLLQQLNDDERLTPAQREQLEYLNAYALSFSGRFDEGIERARLLETDDHSVETRFRAGLLIANIQAIARQFTDGLRQLGATMALADQVKDPKLRNQGFGVAALIYAQIGQYQTSARYAERILGNSPQPRTLCFANQIRMQARQHLGTLPADDAELLQAIDQCVRIREISAASFLRISLARKWAGEGRRDRAIALLRKHLPQVEATGYPHLIGETHALLAQYLLEKGDIDGAERHANATVEQRAGIQFSLPLVLAYKTLYEIAERRGDVATAFEMYRKYAEADKAYLTDVKAREMAYQVVHQETLQKSQQIELLDRKNQVLQLQQRVNEQKANFSRLLILLLVLLLGSIGYWAFKIKRVQVSLRRMAETDALTGICNRHHFSQLSEQVLRDSAKAGEEVALVMFDLDHFKSINDRFGHDTGDWVLKRVTDACKAFCRRIDNLGRLGGEEFAILLSGCDLRGATRVAEDCRVRIASIDSTPSGHKFVVTASFGVTATSLSAYDLAKLLSHADQMLYRAKREGRNRVCTYDGRLQPWPAVQPAVADDPDPSHVDAAAGVAPPAPGR